VEFQIHLFCIIALPSWGYKGKKMGWFNMQRYSLQEKIPDILTFLKNWASSQIYIFQTIED